MSMFVAWPDGHGQDGHGQDEHVQEQDVQGYGGHGLGMGMSIVAALREPHVLGVLLAVICAQASRGYLRMSPGRCFPVAITPHGSLSQCPSGGVKR